jgi:hypothetical protein
MVLILKTLPNDDLSIVWEIFLADCFSFCPGIPSFEELIESDH